MLRNVRPSTLARAAVIIGVAAKRAVRNCLWQSAAKATAELHTKLRQPGLGSGIG
jgi:hypothetical protein